MKDTGHTVSGETLLGLLIFFVTVLTVVSASMSLKASPRPPKTAGTGSARAAAQAANQSPADFVLTNAKIYTEDSVHRDSRGSCGARRQDHLHGQRGRGG